MTEKRAFITIQGNLQSGKKGTDGSGYVVFSGHWPKTFRGDGALEAAAMWALKKGYKPTLVKPVQLAGNTQADQLFNQAVEGAKEKLAAAVAAAAEEER